MDSSNEGPEDFRHQLPHLFLSGDSPNNRRKCQATFGMGILTTYPETLNGMVPKIPKKRIFKLAKSSHSSTGGKPSYLRGQVRPNNRSEKHEKMTSEHWNSDVFFTRCYAYQTWFTSCGTREVFIHQRNAGCRSASGPKKSAPKSEKA